MMNLVLRCHYAPFSNIVQMSRRRLSTLDTSPPVHREMTQALQRDAFHKRLTVLAASVPPEKAGLILKAEPLRGTIINLPKTKSVIPDPARPDHKLVVFRVCQEADLNQDARNLLRFHNVSLVEHDIHLNYDFWTADEIIGAVLPEDLVSGAPSGFAITGHIAHLNLNDEYLPYKYLIGQVILDKNKAIRTVVNKLDSIDTQFRFFKMELLAGEPNYIVEHHESGCVFRFNFTQVYWNSRLHSEHDRLVQLFQPQDVVADVFAGVGPFALPAAKKGCGVIANDLNPESHKYLVENINNNKVQKLVRASAEDGRDFIKRAALRVLDNPLPGFVPNISKTAKKVERQATKAKPTPPPRHSISHFVMNLPDSAIQFLDAFRGVLSSPGLEGIYESMPMVHCHCFTREVMDPARAEEDIRKRVEERLGHTLTDDVSFHLVRSVAPNKDMYCISFRLPEKVAFCGPPAC